MSLGRTTTSGDVDRALEVLVDSVRTLRRGVSRDGVSRDGVSR
jgi:hypothetical protein